MDSSDRLMLSMLFGGYGGYGRSKKSSKPKKVPKDNWFEELSATQCKELAKAAKLKVSGSKQELVQRLLDHDFMSRFTASKKRSTSRRSKPKEDQIQKPLSAYNIFFKEARIAILKENEGKREIPFQNIAMECATRWRNLSNEELARFKTLADEQMQRYRAEVIMLQQEFQDHRRQEWEEAERAITTLERLKEECRKRLLQVSGTKFDLALRIAQHEHGTGGTTLKRAATEMTIDANGNQQPVAKKRKPSKPNPSTMYTRVSKKCQAGYQKKYQSNYGSKNHAPDVERLMEELLRSLKPFVGTDPQLVLDCCNSIVKGMVDNFDEILRPGYFHFLDSLVKTIVNYTRLIRGQVSPSSLEQLATSMIDWKRASAGYCCLDKCDMHKVAHMIRHGNTVPYDEAKAKENYVPPVGSDEWWEQAKKDGRIRMYHNGQRVSLTDSDDKDKEPAAETTTEFSN